MAIGGVVHRTVLGLGPVQFRRLFCVDRTPRRRFSRSAYRLHNRQLIDPRDTNTSELVKRSALGWVRLYNHLDQDTVSSKTVGLFQAKLQVKLKNANVNDVRDWTLLFNPRGDWLSHPLPMQ